MVSDRAFISIVDLLKHSEVEILHLCLFTQLTLVNSYSVTGTLCIDLWVGRLHEYVLYYSIRVCVCWGRGKGVVKRNFLFSRLIFALTIESITCSCPSILLSTLSCFSLGVETYLIGKIIRLIHSGQCYQWTDY